MSTLNFTKMHGLGNDFIVFNAIEQAVHLTKKQIQQLADRHFGIGCDQLLLVEKAKNPQTDFYYRIFNADGSEVEQCGNGARCFARFVQDNQLTTKNEIKVGTAKGNIVLYLEKNGLIKVNMGAPKLQPKDIPFITEQQAAPYWLKLSHPNFPTIQLSIVSMGNPHAVVIVDDLQTTPVKELGKAIQAHPSFPEQANVGFMSIKSDTEIDLRVYERGSGETLACGSGACAAVVAGIQLDRLSQQAKVNLLGGSLQITWEGQKHPVWMTGTATTVYNGTIDI